MTSKERDLRDAVDAMISQLRLCVSTLGMASDALLDYRPKMAHHFETLIKEIETRLEKIRKVDN